MRTIYKYPLPVQDLTRIYLPAGAEVLSVQASTTIAVPGVLWLWAVVDPEQPELERGFAVRGTGHPLGEVGKHLATVQDGMFVWHIFEEAS